MRSILVAMVVAMAVTAAGNQGTSQINEKRVEPTKQLKWQTIDGNSFQGMPVKQAYNNEAREIGFVFDLEKGGTLNVPKSELTAEQIKKFIEFTKARRVAADEQAQKESARVGQIQSMQNRRAVFAASADRIRKAVSAAQGHAATKLTDKKYLEIMDDVLTQFPDNQTKLGLDILDSTGDGPTTQLARALQAKGPNDPQVLEAARAIDDQRLAVLEKMVLTWPSFGLSYHGDSSVTRLDVLVVAVDAHLKEIDAALQIQSGGPGEAENRLLADEPPESPDSQKAPAAGDVAQSVRPEGTFVRPKDGMKHPDLDKAWAAYDTAVAKATESIKAIITEQFDAATAKGDFDSAEKWYVINERFEKAGKLPAETETKALVNAAVADYRKAREELTNAYETLVKNLTVQKRIAEAKAVRKEAADALVSGEERNAERAKKVVFLSDLQERDAFVGSGFFGKGNNAGYSGKGIVVAGRPVKQGLSMHPPANGASTVTYTVPAGLTHFEARAAIDDSAGGGHHTPVVFYISSGKRILWQSQPIRGAGAGEDCVCDLKGAETVTLSVHCPGTHHAAHAVWVDPRFLRK